MKNIFSEASVTETSLPLHIHFEEGISVQDFLDFYNNSNKLLQKELLHYGALLFRGIDIGQVSDFENLTGQLSTQFRTSINWSYPRKKLSSHVYISTEYDPRFEITQHNEQSFSATWPGLLYFGCIIPPGNGGETPLADSRKILDRMNSDLLQEFEHKQVRYVRNLHNGQGMGPSWQETFGTDDRNEVETYCKQEFIEYTWKKDGGLKLVDRRPATRVHPVTGEKVWFNQVDQFHPSHFNPEIYETLMVLADGNKEELPLYASFGDGSEISEDVIKEIRDTIDRGLFLRPWQQGDFIIIDNMLVCHGRKAYTGNRQIVVSMV